MLSAKGTPATESECCRALKPQQATNAVFSGKPCRRPQRPHPTGVCAFACADESRRPSLTRTWAIACTCGTYKTSKLVKMRFDRRAQVLPCFEATTLEEVKEKRQLVLMLSLQITFTHLLDSLGFRD